jgi:NAD(P)-dependent dehydrogenase (short-subunit alcohol dehydrogenase family)
MLVFKPGQVQSSIWQLYLRHDHCKSRFQRKTLVRKSTSESCIMNLYSRLATASIALSLASVAAGEWPPKKQIEMRANAVDEGQNFSQSTLVDSRDSQPANLTLPGPPFTFPFLQSEFVIPPDCGETSYVGTGRLRGRRALVTGGDSGIGRAVAIAFAREGADVTINYLAAEQSDADDVVGIIESTTNSSIYTIPGNIRNESFCGTLVREAAERMAGLDILVLNAGYGAGFGDITNLTTENLRQTTETNIYAPIWMTKAAVDLMPPGSSIVFTASLINQQPPYRLAHYAASKAYLQTLSQALGAGLMATRGIKVNAVRPAIVYTPFLVSQGQTTQNALATAAMTPLGRLQHPVDIAPQFVALVGNDTSYTSGGFY